jgi:hypothetical protein
MQMAPRYVVVLVALLGWACNHSSGPTAQAETPTPAGPAAVPTTPLGTPLAAGCGLGAGTGSGVGCPYNGASFVEVFDRAIEMAMQEHPTLFDLGSCHSPLSCLVPNPDLYQIELVNNLKRQGVCAIRDGDEVAIKSSNDFSDQYQAVTSSGYSRFGIGAYRATCTPAWF